MPVPEHGITPETIGSPRHITQDTIDQAVATVRVLADWHVWPRREETVRVDHAGGRLVFLRTKMLHGVISVVVDGQELDLEGVSWSEDGVIELDRPVRPGLGRLLVIIDHGYEAVPDLVGVISKMASRATGDERSQTVGGISIGGATAPAPQSSEWRIIDQYKLGPMP